MKRITLCALFLTLFLLISCNTSGKDLKDDEVAKSDGTVIDLAKITKNITDSVAFAKDVKEIHSLVKSIDELAKAIGKKIKTDETGVLEASTADQNEQLIAGAFQVILTVETKLKLLEEPSAKISDACKKKVTEAKNANDVLLTKFKSSAKDNESVKKDAEAKKVIDRTDASATDLKKLSTVIDELLKSANSAVESAINSLTISAKS
ncbi:Vsp/OspC family lipoprotein [Borrelia puertoricensis]|uniref:Vsp/OspC family lipoprotein n=1 Tax=Borrelia puertoricensis TaxID=2756107 RepID=UPI001FF3F99E|nr:Vsp/OspC family lipoprotein [Borrelia puertoricensis]